jgi:hypothetical protein
MQLGQVKRQNLLAKSETGVLKTPSAYAMGSFIVLFRLECYLGVFT